MTAVAFDGIRIKYEGLDADRALLDLGQLGASIQGAARLMAAGGHIALTGKFNREDFGKSLRVMTRPPTTGSYELMAFLIPVLPLATPFLPVLDLVFKTAATKVTEAVVNSALAHWSGRTLQEEQNRQVLITALTEMGHTTRTAMEAFERMTLSMHASGRQVVSPVGASAATVQIGRPEFGAFPLNDNDRAAIEHKSSSVIGEEQIYSVVISELDLLTRSCKVNISGDETHSRIAGSITDPLLELPGNPYSSAFDAQTSISVKAKPKVVDGILEKLFISDVAA